MMKLSNKEQETRVWVDEFITKTGYPPTYDQVASKFSISKTAAYSRCRKFRNKMSKKLIDMEKKLKVIPPTMPNFIRFELPAGQRQEGFKSENGFDIKNFTREEAEKFAELMRQEFLKHYENRKKNQQ